VGAGRGFELHGPPAGSMLTGGELKTVPGGAWGVVELVLMLARFRGVEDTVTT